MTTELLVELIEQERERSRLEVELGRLAADVAILARQVADLKRDWPQASIVVVDEANVH
jgi:cell division protein FtsB